MPDEFRLTPVALVPDGIEMRVLRLVLLVLVGCASRQVGSGLTVTDSIASFDRVKPGLPYLLDCEDEL